MTNPLARAIMGNNLKGKRPEEERPEERPESQVNEDYTQLINDLIQGEKKVVEGSSLNKTITLEEAAERVRKGL